MDHMDSVRFALAIPQASPHIQGRTRLHPSAPAMTRCNCPPFNSLDCEPCCRDGGDPCPPARCQHLVSESAALLAELQDTLSMVADAQTRHREADAAVREAQDQRMEAANQCIALNEERKRLWAALERALSADAGLTAPVPERAAPRLVEALAAPVANVTDYGG